MNETPIVPKMFKLAAKFDKDKDIVNALVKKVQEQASRLIEKEKRDPKKELLATIKLQNLMKGRDLQELLDEKIIDLVKEAYGS